MKLLAALVATGMLTTAAAASLTREQAAAFQKKLELILLNAETRSDTARQTPVTEGEVNSYLRFNAGDKLPVGVTDPAIGIAGQNRLNGRAIVDLDMIRRKKASGGWFDPLSYLTGKLPVTATGVLHTQDGRGRFTLETAAISGVPIPKSFLQELVTFYTRSADLPNGINIDDPFELPAGVREIHIHEGHATIVQ